MTKKKLNCWEFKRCGRQLGGDKVKELGICPTATDSRLDGVHSGTNAGRCCWVVSGSLCKGTVQGTYGQKYKDCQQCDFYKLVQKEEFGCFKNSILLLKKLNEPHR